MTSRIIPQQAPSRVITAPALVDAALSQIDQSRDILWDTGLAARDTFASLTKHNPSFSYSHITGSAIRTLRDRSTPTFQAQRRHGVEVTTHQSGDHAILVVRGNALTGNPGLAVHPNSARPRGSGTDALIQDSRQLTFPGMGIRHPLLRVLLLYIDPVTKELRIELSEPADMIRRRVHRRGLYFCGWVERIIIPRPSSRARLFLPSRQSLKHRGGPNQNPGWTSPISPDELDLSKKSDAA